MLISVIKGFVCINRWNLPYQQSVRSPSFLLHKKIKQTWAAWSLWKSNPCSWFHVSLIAIYWRVAILDRCYYLFVQQMILRIS